MALSPYEKRSLFRFMAIYLGASFLVVTAFSILFYQIDSKSIKERVFSHLRMEAMQISASAVDAQMRGTPFEIPQSVGCEYRLIGHDGRAIGGCIAESVDLSRDRYVEDGCAYYIDRSVRGHMGIDAIVVRDCSLHRQMLRCSRNVTMMAVMAYGFLVFVGWYLGRLFLEPMREKIETMDRFIKDSTHELNTPVTTMLLALQKIEKKECKPIYLKALQMSGRLIARVYEDLSFLLLKQESPEPEHLTRVAIDKKVMESIDFFSILAEQKRVDVKTSIEPYQVEADAHHIELLIKNLLDNAIKYTRPGGRIDVTLKKCVLTVSDTGIGIPKEKLKIIFERFHRENSVEGGFGIGLNIVESICKLYGYKVEVHSEEGEGSTFTITFKQT
ncbi:sensor histidine kinase [Hydrogenimonas cancrithermarum]|uniref:histidine kinase n=1 Tax=Hydrogenimonas cancrithermarum TaxID=2993563 RepID=A0ABN6WZD4_9BACT|nr:HAMP domain-containing sensor histidine kinase [Hydrogenimonas cancrithermarum]BDY13712.1 two-component sensor histidine kinase [Hydrogenimonas cancrithermarum]